MTNNISLFINKENLCIYDAMIPLGNLRAFEAAARLLSFTLAAEELHLTQSAVSQQIRQLEQRLGFKVFRRLTRRLELTGEGRRLYETVRRALQDIDRTVAELRGQGDRGTVTISAGSTFASNWLIPRLNGFRARHPEIELRLSAADQLVDLTQETSIDIAVRFGGGGGGMGRGLVVEKLGQEQVFVACSPALLAGAEPPRQPADLARFPLLHNEVSDQEPGAAGDWRNWLAALGLEDALDVSGGPRVPRSDLVTQAALHGQGMALAWHTMVAAELRDGRLVKAFGGDFEVSNSYYAAATREAYGKAKVRRVMDWLRSEATSA